MRLGLCLFILILLTGCSKSRIVRFYSLDKTQCVTVIDRSGYRYIIDGKHDNVPESGYIKLDMRNIDPMVSGFRICWKNENYDWDVVVDQAKVIESNLDTSRFNFNNELPVDKRGISTEIKFRQEGCAVFSYYLMKLSPDQGAIVEID